MTKQSKIPKGLIALSIINIIGSAGAIELLFQPNAHMILFGFVVKGAIFKVYYIAMCLINFLIAIGLLLRRRLAYLSFFIIGGLFILTHLATIVLTTPQTLFSTGWKIETKSIQNFRILYAFSILVNLGLLAWLYRYRNEFDNKS